MSRPKNRPDETAQNMAETLSRPGAFMRLLLSPAAKIFGCLARVRSFLYEAGAFEIVDSGVLVISVGNLTAGGTGKTPITSFLTDVLLSRGFACAIVSRGYGALEKGPALVEIEDSLAAAKRFGDEPSWLANEHRDVPVVIGGRRPESIAFLLSPASSFVSSAECSQSIRSVKAFNTSLKRVVIADDAFQHRRLKRQIDIVILDATEPRWHYKPLPLGRLREGFSALKRASFIFVSKTNLASDEQLAWLYGMIRSTESAARVIDFGVQLNGFVQLEANHATAKTVDLSERRIVLVSGIARPQTFDQLIQETLPMVKILRHFIFRDHYSYQIEDLEGIEREARELGAEAIVVTEKDATKLGAWRPQIPCYVSRLVARPLVNFGEFHEAVDRLF
jgi:tetraacyldisaccharide 4'-kinase